MIFSDLGSVDPEYSVRYDDAILRAHSRGEVPDAAYVYSRTLPTVSMGRSSVAEDCVDLDYARANGIAVVRRASGGSAVFSDTKQLTYSAVFEDDGSSREEVFGRVCACVVEALDAMGIEGVHKPVNDVLVDGRKISGGAQKRFRGSILQHGTLLVADSRDVMERVLIPLKKRSPTVSLEEILGRMPERDEVVSALRRGFSIFDGTLEEAQDGFFLL